MPHPHDLRRLVLAGLLVLPGCAPTTSSEAAGPDAPAAAPAYVDSASCAECHSAEWKAWSGSHHDLAMQPADEATVLGDFDDAVFEQFGVETRFFRRDGKYLVGTEGPDGEPAEFEVSWVFGADPLQQYLIAFPEGRVQCLTIAWDVPEGRWYSLYPDERIPPDDPLHWTGRYQRWNLMCADCHSTALHKGYDAQTDGYDTTWQEIDVGCQTCHGPGAAHDEWARSETRGEAPYVGDLGLVVQLERGDLAAQIASCAPCHSRRTPIVADPAPGIGFYEGWMLERLHEGHYHADGQILDEVYVYGSFAQSKMHERGVTCTDCHDPHGLGLWVADEAVCQQCHSPNAPLERFETLTAKRYDVEEHHHHPPDSEGASCISCHMPVRTYMGVDPRHDHSMRVPRPDLTVAIGTPNACTDCHADEGAQWAADAIAEWTGSAELPPHFAPAFARARRGDPAAELDLAAIAANPEEPAIVRATAIELLRPTVAASVGVIIAAAEDESPLVRAAAARTLARLPLQVRLGALLSLLEDPVRSVRIEAVRGVADAPAAVLEQLDRGPFDAALAEFRAAQELNADQPWAHLNLAVVHADRGQDLQAEYAYRKALELDPSFTPARFNLANVLSSRGRSAQAIDVLRGGLRWEPENGELYYSLGLGLAEAGRLDESADTLTRAAELLPGRPRVRYNQGLALRQVGREDEAERALLEAERLAPADPDIVHALVLGFLERSEWERAVVYARRLAELAPDAPWAIELVQRAEAGLAGEGR